MKYGGARLRTALVYLNNVEEGGGTRMSKFTHQLRRANAAEKYSTCTAVRYSYSCKCTVLSDCTAVHVLVHTDTMHFNLLQ